MAERERCCCNCGNNIRYGSVCHCSVDGHYIGYIECFEQWCKHWRKEHKWDNCKEGNT